MASFDITDQSGPKPELHTPDVFPEPLIIPPKLEHRQSIIILHGRGSFAEKFAPPMLVTKATGTHDTLQTAFPHAKIIFPTASRNRATIYKRSYTHQWFDNWHLEKHTERQDLMTKGLRKSVLYIHSLLRQEIAIVGAENVVLWGLSQGCATALTAFLTWDGEPLAAVVGMSGWLPFANVMLDMLEENESGDDCSQQYDDDPFTRSGDEDDDRLTVGDTSVHQDPESACAIQAVNALREELELSKTQRNTFRNIPIFLGHGTEDDKVKIGLGRESEKCLRSLGARVQMVEYEGLGHWYSEDMFRDIFLFLKDALEIETSEG